MTNDEKPLREVVGAQVRRLRAESGATADDIARMARKYGLRWSRTQASELEQGSKSLNAVELLLLPRIVGDVIGRSVTLADLVDSDDVLMLTPEALVRARGVALLAGDNPSEARILFVSELRENSEAALDAARSIGGVLSELAEAQNWARDRGMLARNPVLIATEQGTGEAERKAIAQLGTTRSMMLVLCAWLWGRSMSAQRDYLVDQRVSPDASPRSVQAVRGRVTRELLEQLRQALRTEETK